MSKSQAQMETLRLEEERRKTVEAEEDQKEARASSLPTQDVTSGGWYSSAAEEMVARSEAQWEASRSPPPSLGTQLC